MAKAKTTDQPNPIASGDGGPGENVVTKSTERENRTVVVACKMPHGVIIRDFRKITAHEPVMGGGSREVSEWRPTGPRIRIKGPVVPDIFIRLVEVVGDYAITEGVPADVFERWMEWNKDSAFVVNKLIYGHENGARVRDWAKEHHSIKSGMEPLSIDMKLTEDGRQVFKDERVRLGGADLVQPGNLKDAAA